MLERRILGLLGVLAAVSLIVGGIWTGATKFAFGTPGDLGSPTLAAAVLTAIVVLGLAAIGIGAARRLRTPYW